MKIKDLKRQLKNESQRFVPDVKDQVYASVGYSKLNNHESQPRIILRLKYALGLMLILSVSLFLLIQPTATVNSYVVVEINPSIEMELNQDGKVIGVNPLNTDGYFFLEVLEIEDLHIDEALVKIIDQASLQGFLQTETSKLTVSAVNKNKKTEVRLNDQIQNVIEEHRPGVVKNNDDLKEESKEYNVTPGKMVIIKKAIEADSSLKINQAAKMQIKDLISIINKKVKEKVDKFENQYKDNLGQLDQFLNRDIYELERRKDIVEQDLEELEAKIPSVDNVERFLDLVYNRFPEYEFNRNKVDNLKELLEEVEEFYDEYFDFLKDLINDNYKNQKESYKDKVNENSKNDVDDFTFNYKDKFWFKDYSNRYSKEEKGAIRIINQIQGLMTNKTPGVIKKIENLYDDYLEGFEELSEEFKQSTIVLEFESAYRNFVEDLDKGSGPGHGKNNDGGSRR